MCQYKPVALRLRFESVKHRLGISVDYQVDGQLALPDQIAEALYRTALEALNNALKHAGANRNKLGLENRM